MVVRWPRQEVLTAIPIQVTRVVDLIRDFLPTTNNASSGIGVFGSATNITSSVFTEFERLTYLFHNRDLADFELDSRKTRELGCPVSLARWIVAFPTDEELALTDQDNDFIKILMAPTSGWPAPIPNLLDSIFEGLSTLRCYFGQGPVFSRFEFIRAGDWLRDYFRSFAIHPLPENTPWFQSAFCRMPKYDLNPPDLWLTPEQQRRPLPIPKQVENYGRHDSKESSKVPIAWIESLELCGRLLSTAITEVSASNPGNYSDTKRFDTIRKWATENLKGKQRRLIELLVADEGKSEISSLATDPQIDWPEPWQNSWNSIRRAVNDKLRVGVPGWKISTHDKVAVLSKIGQK